VEERDWAQFQILHRKVGIYSQAAGGRQWMENYEEEMSGVK
jgi:hypothetical protein